VVNDFGEKEPIIVKVAAGRPIHVPMVQIMEALNVTDISVHVINPSDGTTIRWCRSTPLVDVIREVLPKNQRIEFWINGKSYPIHLPSLDGMYHYES
jgi:hypothetical protein